MYEAITTESRESMSYTEHEKGSAERRVRAAARALEKAESEHTAARAEYEAQYSLLQRACKDLGTRASAYRAEHVTPKEENLKRAQADHDDASAAAAIVAEANVIDSAEATTAADSATDAGPTWALS